MKPRHLIFFFLFISKTAFGQNFTINGYYTHSIYIGLDNIIEFPYSSYNQTITSIDTPKKIKIKQKNKSFILLPTIPIDQFWVKLFSNNTVIDSIELKSERLSFQDLFEVEGYGLISQGSYPKEILQNLIAIKRKFNAPWVESKTISFEIAIYQNKNVLYYGIHKGDNLNIPKIKRVISKLESGGIIEISHLKTTMPYDGQNNLQKVILSCK